MIERITLYDIPADTIRCGPVGATVPPGLYWTGVVSVDIVSLWLIGTYGFYRYGSVSETALAPFAVTYVREKPMEPPLDPPREPEPSRGMQLAGGAIYAWQLAQSELHDEGKLNADSVQVWKGVCWLMETLSEQADQ